MWPTSPQGYVPASGVARDRFSQLQASSQGKARQSKAEQSKKPLEFEAATEAINGMQGRAGAHVRQSRPCPATDKPKNAGSLDQFAMLEADSLVQVHTRP
jgi:hypothetical protein